jgi:hypothetical protein
VSFIGIVFKVSDVGNIAYISNLITQITEVPEEDIKSYGRPGMAQMRIAIYCWTAYINSDTRRMKWFENFFAAGKRVV